MNCPECGKEINDNELFCDYCGAEILTGIPSENSETKKKKLKKQNLPKNEEEKSDRKNKLVLAARIAGIAVIAAVIIIIIAAVSASIKASEGRKIFDKTPLGRDIEIIATETGAMFANGKSSAYGALNHIADYDYICESENSVNVSGIELPEWAVLLKKSGNTVDEATLYNFALLKHNWMGSKTAEDIDKAVIEFGTTIKKAENKIGLKPYTIIKESTENTSTYVYRYHYTDAETGNTVVKNIYIVVSDVDNQVKDARVEQLDYLKLILQAD